MDEQNTKKTPNGRLEELDKILDEYETRIGLSKFTEEPSNDVKEYLSMSREQIEKLDPESCASIALVLGGFAYHLQRAYNRENARVNWADNVLKDKVFGKETQYVGSWESQFVQAANQDEYTRKILRIKNYAKNRADRLHFLSGSVKSIGDLFTNVQRAKVANK